MSRLSTLIRVRGTFKGTTGYVLHMSEKLYKSSFLANVFPEHVFKTQSLIVYTYRHLPDVIKQIEPEEVICPE